MALYIMTQAGYFQLVWIRDVNHPAETRCLDVLDEVGAPAQPRDANRTSRCGITDGRCTDLPRCARFTSNTFSFTRSAFGDLRCGAPNRYLISAKINIRHRLTGA